VNEVVFYMDFRDKVMWAEIDGKRSSVLPMSREDAIKAAQRYWPGREIRWVEVRQ
jgi:hypothetical protein